MNTTGTISNSFSLKRTLGLAHWNAVLLTRNKLAFVYAAVLPLLPILIMLAGERGDPAVGASSEDRSAGCEASATRLRNPRLAVIQRWWGPVLPDSLA